MQLWDVDDESHLWNEKKKQRNCWWCYLWLNSFDGNVLMQTVLRLFHIFMDSIKCWPRHYENEKLLMLRIFLMMICWLLIFHQPSRNASVCGCFIVRSKTKNFFQFCFGYSSRFARSIWCKQPSSSNYIHWNQRDDHQAFLIFQFCSTDFHFNQTKENDLSCFVDFYYFYFKRVIKIVRNKFSNFHQKIIFFCFLGKDQMERNELRWKNENSTRVFNVRPTWKLYKWWCAINRVLYIETVNESLGSRSRSVCGRRRQLREKHLAVPIKKRPSDKRRQNFQVPFHTSTPKLSRKHVRRVELNAAVRELHTGTREWK